MSDYVKDMVEEFPEELKNQTKFPWSEQMFNVNHQSKLLDPKQAKYFHMFVMKGMFLCK